VIDNLVYLGDCKRRLKVYEIGQFDAPIHDLDMIDTWALCVAFYEKFIMIGTDNHKLKVYDRDFNLLDDV